MRRKSERVHVLFFITEDWYFWSHRLPLARAARDQGFNVTVCTRVHAHGKLIEKEGFKLIPIRLIRKRKNIIKELVSVFEIMKIYLKERPDIVHHVALKPIIYGSWAARIAGVPFVVNAFAGLGLIFVSHGWKSAIFRKMVVFVYALIFSKKNTFAIFQNHDDLNVFVSKNLLKNEQAVLIRGSGVNIKKFDYFPEIKGTPDILFASRMLWNKGVGELVDASILLRNMDVDCRVVLVGIPDYENPLSVTEAQLKEWHSKGIIEWLGYQDDIPRIIVESHIVVLPTTYGEGVPKILLEAASCGRPIVATDVPGCREIVRNNENGILIPPHNPQALANALKMLIEEPELRKKMGKRGREIVIAEFSEEIVVQQTMDLYKRLLRNNGYG